MFEILQLSEVKEEEKGGGRRRRGREDSGKKGDAQKQLLYSSVTFVDLPGAVKEPDSKDATRKKEATRLS